MSKVDYKISKYTESIIDGLGYKVVYGDGFQGVESIVDKKTGLPLKHERANLLDLTEEEWLSGYTQELEGEPTDIYEGHNGEHIYLSKYGDATFYLEDGLNIVSSYNNRRDRNTITINSEKGSISLSYIGNSTENPDYLRNSIRIEVPHLNDSISCVRQTGTRWVDYGESHEFTSFNDNNITKHIMAKIKRYNGGAVWNNQTRKGLEVISSAIALYIRDFRRDWVERIDEFVKEEKEDQKKYKKEIDKLIDQMEDSRLRVNSLKNTQKILSRNSKN